MSKIAVDIALLPPDEVMDLAIDLNQKLAQKQKQDIILDKRGMLPHISLAMGVIDESKLKDVKRSIGDIAAHVSPPKLELLQTKTIQLNGGKPSIHLSIKNTERLQSIHHICVTKLSAFFENDVKLSAYAKRKDEQMSKSARDYLDNFLEKHAFDSYDPHITLGHGAAPKLTKKMSFATTRLALCRLGNHNTCREVLAEFELKS